MVSSVSFVSPTCSGAMRRSSARVTALVAIVLSLAACERTNLPAPSVAAEPTRESQVAAEIAWTAAALARNPDIEVLATDAAAGVFTVRVKSSGEVRALKLGEIAAAPINELSARIQTPAIAAEPVAPATPALANSRKAEPAVATAPQATTEPAPVANNYVAPAPNEEPAKGYTIERAGGQVKVSGPGVSIVSSGRAAGAGANATDTVSNTEPVICEGKRMLHLDNRVITSSGNAVIARGGCELYITNSRISAVGTGVIVKDAVVHISNSTIEGATASFEADESARLFVRSSTFKGVTRRGEKTVVQDQGGNQWR